LIDARRHAAAMPRWLLIMLTSDAADLRRYNIIRHHAATFSVTSRLFRRSSPSMLMIYNTLR